MIDVTVLRNGNMLNYNGSPCVILNNNVGGKIMIDYSENHENKVVSINDSLIQWISLNKKLLIKMGFEGPSQNSLPEYTLKINDGCFLLGKDVGSGQIAVGVIWYDSSGQRTYSQGIHYYVHEVQNLYFSLTHSKLLIELRTDTEGTANS